MNTADCVVIGNNEISFNEIASRAKLTQKRSGDFAEIARNSYPSDGNRLDMCGLLNRNVKHSLGYDPQFSAFDQPNLAAHLLANYMSAHDIKVEIINLFNKERDRLYQLLSCAPTAVIITTTFYISPEPIKEIVAYVKTNSPYTKIIIGGPFISRTCMAHTPAEQEILFRLLEGDIFIVDAQGERTLLQTMRALLDGSILDDVPNLVFRNTLGNGLVRTERRPESNLLENNTIDWNRSHADHSLPITSMRTSRGCPFSCAFCNYPALGGKHQIMPIEPVLAEMRQLQRLGTRYILFVDDSFNVPLSRFKTLLKRMIAERFTFRWISFFRCSHVDDECFDLMAQSGCLAVYLGIESGDETVLRAMNKYATAYQYRQGIHKLHERGIATFGSFIVGHPGETPQSVRNTLKFIEETRPTFFNAQLFFLDPQAPIAQRHDEHGITGAHYNWRHRTMSWQEASGWTDHILKSVTQSIQLPLYGFGIWSLPYLLDKGFTLEQVKGIASTAQSIMIKSLDDQEQLYKAEQTNMDRILIEWDTRRNGAGSKEGQS